MIAAEWETHQATRPTDKGRGRDRLELEATAWTDEEGEADEGEMAGWMAPPQALTDWDVWSRGWQLRSFTVMVQVCSALIVIASTSARLPLMMRLYFSQEMKARDSDTGKGGQLASLRLHLFLVTPSLSTCRH